MGCEKMKGNIHKKITFDDGDSKHYIKNDLKGWALSKRLDRKTVRRKMDAMCRKEYAGPDLPQPSDHKADTE